jgi:hypothetical protein
MPDRTNEIAPFQRYELVFPAPDVAGNPFDTREIALIADIIRPDGSQLRLGGFAYQPYVLPDGTNGSLDCAPVRPADPLAAEAIPNHADAIDTAYPAGPIAFHLRYAPTMQGEHHLATYFRLRDGRTLPAGEFQFSATTVSSAPGYIRISPNHYTFMTENGEAFYPIGSNLCWPNSYGYHSGQRMADWTAMLERLAAAGGTAFRLWANAPWAHAIDWTAVQDDHPLPFGAMNLAGCAKIDYIVETAERLGLRIMFCIDAANNWASNDLNRTPYGKANGGPCATTADYFNLPEARAMTREKMKYVAARWGYSPAIWCWEFWNEVDGCGIDQVTAHQQLAWHQEMARVLRAADPGKHIVTTSTGHPLNFTAMWRAPEIEFTHTHHYGYMDSVDHISTMLKGYHEANTALYRKPHFASEVGVTFIGKQSVWETDGSTLHNILWSTALLPKSCGPGFLWFWDEYVDRYNLYYQYEGIAHFLREERWHEVQTEALAITAEHIPARSYAPPRTAKIATALSGSDFYQSIFTIQRDGSVDEGMHLIPNTHYGVDRPLLNFRLTFLVDYPMDGEFIPMVWGGGTNCNGIESAGQQNGAPIAEIRLDGKIVLRREVITQRAKGAEDLYCDRLAIKVTSGKHEISLTNIGEGLFITGHIQLTNYCTGEPRVSVQGLRYDDHACFWLYNRDYTWHTAKYGTKVEPVIGMGITLRDMPPGTYRFDWWDTVRGEVIATSSSTTDEHARLYTTVPNFTNDLAGKCSRISDLPARA